MVYFVFCEMSKLVKIGVTADMENRFKTLQSSSGAPLRILKTIPGDTDIEKEFHERFRKLRHHGEWFMLADELFSFLEKEIARPLFEQRSEPLCNNCPIRATSETAKGEPLYERIKYHTIENIDESDRIPKFLTEKELEIHLQLNKGELKEWRKRRQLPFPAYQISTRIVNYKVEDVNQWLKSIKLS